MKNIKILILGFIIVCVLLHPSALFCESFSSQTRTGQQATDFLEDVHLTPLPQATWTPDTRSFWGQADLIFSILNAHPYLFRKNTKFRANPLEVLTGIENLVVQLGTDAA